MVHIVSDTTSGLPLDVAAEHGVTMVPQIIVFGEETYRDDTEMDTQAFLEKLRASDTLPKTAAPPPALYEPIYEELTAEGDTVICLHPSTDLSGTVRSATVAAQDFPEADIRVVDTRTIAAPLASMVLLAAEWAREGVDADTIIERVQDLMERQKVYFVVDTLEYLHRGGRIGGAKALLGGLLQIKPILTLEDGRVDALEQQRTHKRAVARLRELIVNGEGHPGDPDAHLAVMHVDAEDEARELAEYFAGALDLSVEQIPIYLLPPAIVVHGGPGILGATYFQV
jgi:DegV family protein with EDD domain